MASVVYGIYDNEGNLRYIGSSEQSVEQRFATHTRKAKFADESSDASPLRKWIYAVGPENVHARPLMYVEDHMRLEMEKKAIKAFDSTTPGMLNVWHTPRGAVLMSEIGRRPEVREKRSAAMTGREYSEETRRKISEATKKQDLSVQVSKMHAARRGSRNTPEHNRKIRLRTKHQWHKRKDTFDEECKYCVEGDSQ